MRRHLAAFTALLLIAFGLDAAPRRRAVPPPTEFSDVDQIARKALADGIPGLSIAILYGDRPIFAKAYGVENVSTKVATTPGTVFEIGSITKQMTAAAIMRLVESGRVRVDEKAGTLVPELDAKFATVTIEHLLTHTSGIPEYLALITSHQTPKTVAQMMAIINQRPPDFAPGATWSYSNSNYYLLGLIIERLSADNYPHYMEMNFFLPLGLTQTSYCTPPLRAGYVRQGSTIALDPPFDMSLATAAGAICSTATDLARWNHALVTGRAVSSLSYSKMTTPVRLNNGTRVAYGYGLGVSSLDGHPRAWHDGAISGYMADLAWYPDDDLTIAVLVNLRDDHGIAIDINDQIARSLLK